MFADTAAIGAAGADLRTLSATLDAIAAALPSAAHAGATALGPVGADFIAAVRAALAESAQFAALIAADLRGAAGTAARSATGYVEAEQQSISALGR
ncbi:hypothetical protein [Mycobacterium sp. C31M]